MIVIPRGLARAFRAVARKCVSGRPRGPAPAVAFEVSGGTLSAWAATGDAGLLYAAATATPGGDDRVVVPMEVLAAVEGGGGPAELAAGPGPQGTATWADRGVPRTPPCAATPPADGHRRPDPPADWRAVPAAFLAALHECGRTAAKEPSRYALHRVQLRGGAGQVVGSDGKAALLWGGFALPFGGDLLVPAVPAFGCRELSGETDLRVGRTDTHVVVRAGPWSVWLAIDQAGRFPDVAAVLPRSSAPSVAGLDGLDALALLDALPGLPGAGEGSAPVTLDLDGTLAVRARDAGGAAEVRLSRSPVAGPPGRVALDRAYVARALRLGCRTLRVYGSLKPVVFEGGAMAYVAMTLDASAAVAPDPLAAVVPTDPVAPAAGPNPKPTPLPRSDPMGVNETNGHGEGGRADPPPGDGDPLAAAEELRAALGDAAAKAGRLVAMLKHQRKEKRALSAVWAGLKQLNLGAEGRP